MVVCAMDINLSILTTEQRNLRTKKIDQMTTSEILEVINDEDRTVAEVVRKVLPQIEGAIEAVYRSLANGGRLFYIGAGTSGRLGVIDAVECPPTFSTSPDMVQAIIAGGEQAIQFAVEGAEDEPKQGAKDLEGKGINHLDVVVGITASGRTPYVIGALTYAQKIGASTVALSCNYNADVSRHADHRIEVIVGPEILTGSTRMKAATAHKMVLNMITTTTMIKLGKIYENLMVDVHASNLKLIERSRNIVMSITNVTYQEAALVLDETNQEVKPAIVMIEAGVTFEVAKETINKADGFVRKAIEIARGESHG
jgi:N-acetylmuramic acid 6-phosphate etherase